MDRDEYVDKVKSLLGGQEVYEETQIGAAEEEAADFNSEVRKTLVRTWRG